MNTSSVVAGQRAITLQRTTLYQDVSDDKTTFDPMPASEERLRSAIEQADIGVWHWNLLDNTMFWSDKCREILGVAPDAESTIDCFLSCVPPHNRELTRQSILDRIADRTAITGEFRIVRPDGSSRWVTSKGRAIYSASGKPVRAEGLLLDITERKRAENLSSIQRRILQELATGATLTSILHTITHAIESQADGLLCSILLLDSDGSLHCGAAPSCSPDYNAAIEGVKIGPSVGSCGTAAFRKDVVIVSDIATDPLWRDFRDLALSHGLLACWSSPIFSKEGSVLGTFAIYYREARRPEPFHLELIQVAAGLAGVAIERKREEESLRESSQRLRLALESGSFGTWHLDMRTHRFLEISDTHKANFGVAPDAEFTYATLNAAVHPDDLAYVKQCAQQAIECHTDYQAEYRCIWPDGTVHWIGAHGVPVYDEADRPIGMIGLSQEITERKQLEARQEVALKEALASADRDPLTGLLNHRAFHAKLDQESERTKRDDTVLAVVMLDLDNFKFFNDVYGHAAGDEVLREISDRIHATCRPYDTLARYGGDEFALLLSSNHHTTAHDIEIRLQSTLDDLVYHPDGHESAIPISVSVGVALFPIHGSECLEVLKLADERLRWAKTGGATEGQAQNVRAAALNQVKGFSMLDALVISVDNKDRYTRRHSEDVMTYCLMIARQLGLDETAQHTLAVASLLHDVGKIGVPDAILRKPGPLTAEEFEAVKQHPEMGAIIVSAVPGLESTLDAVRHHHERWDGGGYPHGLAGEAIPPPARLMAVADAFSAMTSDRPYRQGMPVERAFAILQAGAGTYWDPICVHAMRQAWPRANAGK